MPKFSHSDQGILHMLAQYADSQGHLSYYDFINIALYDPRWGYYRRPGKRVGQSANTDFYTASSLAPTFGRLVLEAASKLYGKDTEATPFIEIGAEPGVAIFDGLSSAFSEQVCYRLNNARSIPSPAVVFANEVLDAQPFHRFIFEQNSWRELGVSIESGQPREIILDKISSSAAPYMERLPQTSTPGYITDMPSGAEIFLKALIPDNWEGLLILADYGKSVPELLYETPQGTARAYKQHTQKQDLVNLPGEQDITCHLGWDWVTQLLSEMGFSSIELHSQEAFFIKNSEGTIKDILKETKNPLSPEKSRLKALLHPAHFGQKFQILSAKRTRYDI